MNVDLTCFAPSRAEVDGRLTDVLVPERRWYDALMKGEGDEPIHRWTLKVHQDLNSPSIDTDCWAWTSSVSTSGYGAFHLGGQKVAAHAVLWAVEHGSPPALAYGQHGWERIHLGHECHDLDTSCAGGPTCRHRRCVRVDHLRLMTHSANVRAGRSGEHLRSRTECPSGHDYATSGFRYTDPAGVTRRYCQACKSGGRATEFVGVRKAARELAVAA